MDFILDMPRYFYLGLVYSWWTIQALPWPAPGEWFGSMAIFIGLYPIRLVMKAVLPDEKLARRYRKHGSKVPTTAEHQGASAIASNLFHH